MTDEQLNNIIEALKQSNVKDDLFVATVSGLIILAITSLVSFVISQNESKKTKDAIEKQISLEAAHNLKSKREFYLDQLKMDDLVLLGQLFFDYESLFQKIRNAIIASGHSGEYSRQLSKEIADGLVRYPNQITGITTMYSDVFSDEEIIKIDECITKIEAISVIYVNPYVEDWKGKLFEQKEVLTKLTKELSEIIVMIRIKRHEEYEKMKKMTF